MREYPKHPQEIMVRIIHQDVEEGLRSSIKKVAEISLDLQLNDYLLRLGYSSAHILAIMVQLMTNGKITVDFTGHTERIELINPEDKISATQTIQMLEDYITEVSTHEDLKNPEKVTQKIVIPRIRKTH